MQLCSDILLASYSIEMTILLSSKSKELDLDLRYFFLQQLLRIFVIIKISLSGSIIISLKLDRLFLDFLLSLNARFFDSSSRSVVSGARRLSHSWVLAKNHSSEQFNLRTMDSSRVFQELGKKPHKRSLSTSRDRLISQKSLQKAQRYHRQIRIHSSYHLS